MIKELKGSSGLKQLKLPKAVFAIREKTGRILNTEDTEVKRRKNSHRKH